jgi:uncharacterized cupredoxin-like copper-binding protein
MALVAGAAAATAITLAQPAAIASPPKRIAAKLGEYSIKVDRSSAAHGRITFTIRNDGQQVHEFIVLKSNFAADKLPRAGNKAEEDAAGRVIDEAEDIKPGKTAKLSVNLNAGKYVLLCNLPRHYHGGMHVALRVR